MLCELSSSFPADFPHLVLPSLSMLPSISPSVLTLPPPMRGYGVADLPPVPLLHSPLCPGFASPLPHPLGAALPLPPLPAPILPLISSILSLPFFLGFPSGFLSPALCHKVASRLLTTPQGIPQVARACVIGWLEKPFRLECERPVTPPPWPQDFQHCECSQPSPNTGPSVLWVSHLSPAPMLARLGTPI